MLCCAVLSHFSRVWLCVTVCIVAVKIPWSVGFYRQEYRSRLPFSLPGTFPIQGSNLQLLRFMYCTWILYCWVTREDQSNATWLLNLLLHSTVAFFDLLILEPLILMFSAAIPMSFAWLCFRDFALHLYSFHFLLLPVTLLPSLSIFPSSGLPP